MASPSYCAKCGTALPADAAFCPSCGTSITGGAPASQPVVSVPAALPHTRVKGSHPIFGLWHHMRRWQKIVIVLFIAAIILAVFQGIHGSSEQKSTSYKAGYTYGYQQGANPSDTVSSISQVICENEYQLVQGEGVSYAGLMIAPGEVSQSQFDDGCEAGIKAGSGN